MSTSPSSAAPSSAARDLTSAFANAADETVQKLTLSSARKRLYLLRAQLEKSLQDLKGQRRISMKGIRDGNTSLELKKRYKALFYKALNRVRDIEEAVKRAEYELRQLQTQAAELLAGLPTQDQLKAQKELLKEQLKKLSKHGKIPSFKIHRLRHSK